MSEHDAAMNAKLDALLSGMGELAKRVDALDTRFREFGELTREIWHEEDARRAARRAYQLLRDEAMSDLTRVLMEKMEEQETERDG